MTYVVCVVLPIKVVSVANLREHWAKKATRTRRHRETASTMLKLACREVPAFTSARVTLTRIGPRALDSDNLSSSLKATRDGVADWLKHDDGSQLLGWVYAQRKGKPKQYAAEVTVELELEGS